MQSIEFATWNIAGTQVAKRKKMLNFLGRGVWVHITTRRKEISSKIANCKENLSNRKMKGKQENIYKSEGWIK